MNYLDTCFPTNLISKILIYTDDNRYWLAESLAVAAKNLNWELHVSSFQDLEDDDIADLSQSIALLSPDTLLVSIISSNNKNIDILNEIFNPLVPPIGYSGFSLILDTEVPDQFLAEFLELDYEHVIARIFKFMKSDINKLSIGSPKSENSMELQLDSNFIHLPFIVNLEKKAKHIFFPSTIIAARIKKESMNGVLELNHLISPYFEDQILIEPFGKIIASKLIRIRIEGGEIVEIIGNSILCDRLRTHIFDLEPHKRRIIKISIGYGHDLFQGGTGIASLDRLLNGFISFGLIEDRFEFILQGTKLNIIE